MKPNLKYLSKNFLIATFLITSAFVQSQEKREIALHEDEIAIISQNDQVFVFLGKETSAILATMLEILNLADNSNEAPYLRTLVKRAKAGYQAARKEAVMYALEKEARVLIQKHHKKIAHDDDLENLVTKFNNAWDLVCSDALTLAPYDASKNKNPHNNQTSNIDQNYIAKIQDLQRTVEQLSTRIQILEQTIHH